MILVLCAMKEERDALIDLMSDVSVKPGKKLYYQGGLLDTECYEGKIDNKDVVVSRCGVAEIYASMVCTIMIEKYKPDLVINLGVAGSLNENVHVNDVVIATKAGLWGIDVPEESWKRSFNNIKTAYPCDVDILEMIRKINFKDNVHIGPIVSADEFIYNKQQVNLIKKHYPEALCGEMEGAAIAGVCYAFNTPATIIRSISDETLVEDDFKNADFNLNRVCKTAADICVSIIKRF